MTSQRSRLADAVRRTRRKLWIVTAAASIGSWMLLAGTPTFAQRGGSVGGGGGGGAAAGGGGGGAAASRSGGNAGGSRGGVSAAGGAGARTNAGGRGASVQARLNARLNGNGNSGGAQNRAQTNPSYRSSAAARSAGGANQGAGGAANQDASANSSDFPEFPQAEKESDVNNRAANRGLNNAANRLESNAERNRNRGQMNSANQLQSNSDRLRAQATGGLTAEEAAQGVLPSERSRARTNAGGSGAVDTDNPYRTPPWQNPERTGIPSGPSSAGSAYPPEASRARAAARPGSSSGAVDTDNPYRTPPWQNPETTGIPSNSAGSASSYPPDATRLRSGARATTSGSGAVDSDNPYRSPPWQNPTTTGIPSDSQQSGTTRGGYSFDDTSGITDRFEAFRLDTPSEGTSQRGQGTPRDANDNGVLDAIEPYQPDAADTISPTQDNGQVSPGDWNRNTDTINPVSENTTDALDNTDLDAKDNTGTATDPTTSDDLGATTTRSGSTSGLTRGSGVQRDRNADGVLDSIEPYQFDSTDTISPTQDNGQVSPGDWNRNTDTIDPVSENTTDALDTTNDGSATDATNGDRGAATTGNSTTARTATTGATARSRTSASGTMTSRSSSLRASETSGLSAGANADADLQTPALRRAARLLGTSGSQNVSGNRGLERARTRASSNAAQGLDRATERTETNATRFRERFDLDE